MSDWWSKKLAGEKPSVPRTNLPPPNVPMRFPASVTAGAQPNQHHGSNEPEPDSLSAYLRSNKTNGGEAARKENQTCPDCGSQYVFSRTGRGQNTTVNGAHPAPRCYECGWNGVYSQANQVNWTS